MRHRGIAGAALLAAMTAGCVPRAAPPAPVPAPPPAPRPLPPPAPAPPPPVNWLDAPLSPGDWRYRQDPSPRASFDSEGMIFALRCAPGGRITIALDGARAAELILRTSYGERRLPAGPVHDDMTVTLAAADPLFDQLAFSRGRFQVQVGARTWVLPAWPEIARVTEDCRGGG